ncbi:hypothetical protein BROUX41_006329 [Berkeleyomyces rouxiae]|uniref:uncharacterized protein n=1 Tax=Berkeleyomyces rouxiae TaxID=2035830 RepID=UPI003B77FCD2
MVSPWLIATALFCSQVLGGIVPVAENIDLKMHTQEDGWIRATSWGGFDAEVYISKSSGYILISHLIGDGRFTDAEGLLSMWEADTGIDAGNLKYIKYIGITDETTNTVLDSFWRNDNIDVSDEGDIGQDVIYRPEDGDSNWRWSSLRNTELGGVGLDICTEFDETSGFYISSFDYGREGGYEGRWLRINFST